MSLTLNAILNASLKSTIEMSLVSSLYDESWTPSVLLSSRRFLYAGDVPIIVTIASLLVSKLGCVLVSIQLIGQLSLLSHGRASFVALTRTWRDDDGAGGQFLLIFAIIDKKNEGQEKPNVWQRKSMISTIIIIILMAHFCTYCYFSYTFQCFNWLSGP